jgi:hypothetical protein
MVSVGSAGEGVRVERIGVGETGTWDRVAPVEQAWSPCGPQSKPEAEGRAVGDKLGTGRVADRWTLVADPRSPISVGRSVAAGDWKITGAVFVADWLPQAANSRATASKAGAIAVTHHFNLMILPILLKPIFSAQWHKRHCRDHAMGKFGPMPRPALEHLFTKAAHR